MKPTVRFTACILTMLSLSHASAQAASAWQPSAVEIVKLPQYCWGQFLAEYAKAPGYTITNCGGGMNHFCVGLVYLNRASVATTIRQLRMESVRSARVEIDYTLQRMTPDCPIAVDVRQADARQRILEKSLK